MRKVLNDEALNAEFVKNGYVRVPFISPEEVRDLMQNFFDVQPLSGGQIMAGETGVDGTPLITYDFTFIDKNIEYKRRVFDIITSRFRKRMDELLADYKPVIANYIRKKKGTGEVLLHENWAFADEQECYTVSIWCPLVDSTVANGTIQVVPGSHKRFGEIRGPMIPWELDGIRQEIMDRYLVPLDTLAGDCVILDDSIVHYTTPNITDELRVAIQLICIPAEMPSIHYHMDPAVSAEVVQVLEVDSDFYMQFNPWKKPVGAKYVKTIPYRHRAITEREFVERLDAPGYDEQ